jgi:flagellar basal body-associated protein FliL
MIGKLKIGLLYVLPGIIVLGAFSAGHMSITPEADRLADPNDVAEITEPVEEVDADAGGGDAAAGAAAAMLGLPQYQYFPYRTTLVGNIEDTNQLFSFEIAVAVYDKKIFANASMDVLAELELQLTPLILNQTVGMSADVLLSKDGRETLKLQIKDMLNETLEKWGHSPFVHAVEITSFVIT